MLNCPFNSSRSCHWHTMNRSRQTERSTDAGFHPHLNWFQTSRAKSVSNVYKVQNSKLRLARELDAAAFKPFMEKKEWSW